MSASSRKVKIVDQLNQDLKAFKHHIILLIATQILIMLGFLCSISVKMFEIMLVFLLPMMIVSQVTTLFRIVRRLFDSYQQKIETLENQIATLNGQ